jgi:hypothetical protein
LEEVRPAHRGGGRLSQQEKLLCRWHRKQRGGEGDDDNPAQWGLIIRREKATQMNHQNFLAILPISGSFSSFCKQSRLVSTDIKKFKS